MAEFKNYQDDEINSLFDDARKELAKVDENAKEIKKDIVKNLAKKLDGKIPTDTISIEIVNQLRGSVSERFVRECLPDKYKQKHKIENAKKQKKQKQEEYNNLAAVTPLDNKEVIIVDTDGRTSLQKDDEDSSKTETDDSINDKTYTRSSSSSQLEQEHNIKYDDGHIDSDSEDHDAYGIDESSELPPEELHQGISTAGEIAQASDNASKPNFSADILPFEISWSFKELRKYLTPLYSKIGDNGRIWFSGRLNKNTGEVISQYFGRLYQQHDDGKGIDSSNRDDADEL